MNVTDEDIYIKIKIKEEWKKIKNYPYKISNLGRVKRNKKGQRTHVGKILKSNINTNGYLYVVLSKDAKQKTFTIHKLVAEAFLGPCPKDKEVNHIDGDKTNPFVGNLEYVTKSENHKHAFRIGLRSQRGENNANSKLKEKDVKKIKKAYNTGKYYQREIAKFFGVDQSQISNVILRKVWK